MWLLEYVFVDPMSAQFAAFYLPGLLVVLALALMWPKATKPTRSQPQEAKRGSLVQSAIDFGRVALDRLAAADITPNQVTALGLILVAGNCAAYVLHRNPFWLGIGLTLSYIFDALDGVVARRQGTSSKFGGYFDAVIDRYQEIVTYAAIGWVNDWWALAFFLVTGSMLVSYNKARAAIEIPVENKGWPDLLIRHRRLWLVVFGLLAAPWVPWILYFVLICLAVASHLTALQRFMRARRMLLQWADRNPA